MVTKCNGIATGDWGKSAPLTAKKLPKIVKKRKKIRKKREKIRKKRKNQEGPFSLPLLTDRAGYTTGQVPCC